VDVGELEEGVDDPLARFRSWHESWVATGAPDPAAAVLATAGRDGRPSARYVNVVRVDHGFVFFTDHRTRKAADLAANPSAALCFGFLGQDRQVRVEGTVERLPDGECDERFAGLPRAVQVVLWASDGHSAVAGRDAVLARVAELGERFGDGPLPRPPDWGGYRLVPEVVELWEGRDDHVHDRVRFRRAAGGGWSVTRVAP
jgi:pyridoxamine 5'-phosphate oxidase